MVNYLQEHYFRYKQAYSTRSFLLAVAYLSLMVTGCSQKTAVNPPANSNSASQVVSNNQNSEKNSEKNNLVRLGYQKGGIIPISRQRGDLEKQLTTQNIKVEWTGPFDRCATLLATR